MIPGLFLGVRVLLAVDANAARTIAGVVLLGVGGITLLAPKLQLQSRLVLPTGITIGFFGGILGGINLEIHGVRDANDISRWSLQWIEATERRKGSGTAVMRELIRAADLHSREITLKATSRRGARGIEELVAYYQRFGFRRLGGPSRVRVMMARSPQSGPQIGSPDLLARA